LIDVFIFRLIGAKYADQCFGLGQNNAFAHFRLMSDFLSVMLVDWIKSLSIEHTKWRNPARLASAGFSIFIVR